MSNTAFEEEINANGRNAKQEIIQKLEAFCKYNPTAQVESKEDATYILNPWGDSSLAFRVKEDEDNDLLFEALNNILLPQELTALYHHDKSTLEFIFSVRKTDDSLWSRNFLFNFNGIEYKCYYEKSTERLLQIAASMIEMRPDSATDFRNLSIIRDFTNQEILDGPFMEFFADRKAMSFFIEPIMKTNIDAIIELAKNLNFYMSYVDKHTPIILFHSPAEEEFALHRQENQADKEFPKEIIGRSVDTFLLDLWHSAKGKDSRLSFIYYYQLLEYAGFYYIDEKTKLSLAKILKRPDIMSSIDTALPLIIDRFADFKMGDDEKISAVIAKCVDPARIWKPIQNFKDYFSENITFDGGFGLEPLIKKGWDESDFVLTWNPKLTSYLRKIRNALVHARDVRMGQVISPTVKNSDRLRPWVGVIEEVACQVALFRNI